MPTVIEETSTITAKGQTTVPKAVRQALGVDYGGKIAFRVEDGRVTVHNPEAEHRDPALAAFLGLIEKDIAAGRHVRDLPANLAAALRRAMKEARVDLDAPLEGDVELQATGMVVNGWTLLFHEAIVGQLSTLARAYERARKADPKNFRANANVRLFAAAATLMLETIPADPGRPEYRQGNTLGPEYRHWFRARFFGRFRLFFRYDSRARIIVYAWVNDERTLRQRGGRSDPYAVFRRMLEAGHPLDDWKALVKSAGELPGAILRAAYGEEGTAGKK